MSGSPLRTRGAAARKFGPRLLLSAASFALFGFAGWWIVRATDRTGESHYLQREDGCYTVRFVDSAGQMVSKHAGKLALAVSPFTCYRNLPDQRNACLSIDANGFRGGLPAGDSITMVVGGSAAFGFGTDRNEDALPAQLSRRCGEGVVNAAVVGYVSGQELSLIVHHLDRFRPVRYVVFNGFNDYVEILSTAETLGVNGAFFGFVAQLRGYHLMMTEGGDGPDGARFLRSPPDPTPHRVLERYVVNVEKMHAWARARGAEFLVVLQPYLGSRRAMTEDERALPLHPGTAAGYTRFAHEATMAFKGLGIPVLNLHAHPRVRDATEGVFLDPIHLTAAGNALCADLIAARLLRP